jgi:hypothetical protein
MKIPSNIRFLRERMREVKTETVCDNVEDYENKQHKSTVPKSEWKLGILPKKSFCQSPVKMPIFFGLPIKYRSKELFHSLEDSRDKIYE